MLRSLQQLFGAKLGGSDGAIGRVKDFYFDDRNWAIRYLIADTDAWLPARHVLIAPCALASMHWPGELLVNLSRTQIASSPLIDKPITRQSEEDYHQYYSWPRYWQGDALRGASSFPNLSFSSGLFPSRQPDTGDRIHESAEAHLRSIRTLKAYGIQTTDAITGHLCDFLIDEKSWGIVQLVVKTGRRFSGQEVQIPTSSVERISNQESTVFVNLTKEALGQRPEHPAAAIRVAA